MSSSSDARRDSQVRTYDRETSIVFRKTREEFGGLSNMAAGFPLTVNSLRIRTAEALYQACRFPHRPEIQRLIIDQRSPMTAKMKSKPHRHDSRRDWDRVRISVMRWCLRVKLAQNWQRFRELLLATGDRPIVEDSRRDDFWGAKPVDGRTLVGMNVLGRLLMELREEVRNGEAAAFLSVGPPNLPDFLLDGGPIEEIVADVSGGIEPPQPLRLRSAAAGEPTVQTNLFDAPSLAELPESGTAEGHDEPSGALGLSPYAAYRDSGVPWLGEVPAHWRMERGKWLFTKMDRSVRPIDEVVTCFRDGMVTLRRNRRTTGFTESVKEIGYQGVRRGDLVIHAMDAFAGAVGVSDSDGKSTPVYSVCQPRRGANAQYYAYTIREMARSQWIAALAKGVRERSTDFRFSGFAAQFVPVPPEDEQATIVLFLDHADRRIRRYIGAKQRLIALLEEQKQAIVQRAVTRGLDPNTPLKPSGVEWLGDLPEHWTLTRVKNEFACLNSRRIPLSATERGEMTSRDYDYYGASGVIDKVDNFIFDDELVLIAEDGANLVLRNLPLAIIARGKFWVNNHAHILKPRRGNLEFLASSLEALDFRPWISGAAQPKLTKDRLMRIVIAVPGPDEQDAIMAIAREVTTPLRVAIEEARRKVDLLREYRTRLIADVVTGKLDVRAAAADLPDGVDEVDQPDDFEDIAEEELAAALDEIEA